MRRGRVIIALVVGGVALLVGWIAANTYWETAKVPGLMRGAALRNPFYAAGRLAERLGASLRELHDPLAPLPAAGQVLLLVDTRLELEPERLRQVEDWVMQGGHLLIDQSDSLGDLELQHWAGITQSFIRRRKSGALETDAEEPTGSADDVVRKLASQACMSYATRHTAAGDADTFELCDFYPTTRLQTARRPEFALGDEAGLQVLRVPLGRGSLSLLNAHTPFDNRDLLRGDHALLFATLTRLQRGATIWVLRGGASPDLLGLIWNRAAAVVVLLGAALFIALWRAATRFGPVRPPGTPMRRSLRAQIAGTARFLRASGADDALLRAGTRALDAAFARRLPHHSRLAPPQRVAALARLTGLPAGELDDALYGAPAGRGEHLPRRLALLEQARRRLLDH